MTVERALERFVAIERARGRSEGYLRRFPPLVRDLLGFLRGRGKDDLREAAAQDLVAYLRRLEERQKPASVTNVFFQLRRLFAFLAREGLLLRDPMAGLHRKRGERRLRDWLSEAEALTLLRAPDTTRPRGLRDRALLEVLYSCGLRVGELVRLDLDDLDLGERLVTVRESKSGCFRRVPIGTKAAAWVAKYLGEARPKLRESKRPTLAVFLGVAGKRMARSAVETMVAQAGRKARIEKAVTPHVLRHSFAVHLLKNGASTRHIQAMLGHRHLGSTQVYTRMLPADLKRIHRRSHPAEKGLPKRKPQEYDRA